MDLTHDDVLEILAIIERSGVAYLELQVGDTRIVADRAGTSLGRPASAEVAAAPAVPASSTPVPAAPTPPEPAPVAQPSPTAPPDPEPAPRASTEPRTEELLEVPAPVVGVFYRAPEPGAAPYVEVGSRVQVGDTLGLVEVMKMFNSVTAEIAGEVVAILADNEDFVEFGQTLLTIRAEV